MFELETFVGCAVSSRGLEDDSQQMFAAIYMPSPPHIPLAGHASLAHRGYLEFVKLDFAGRICLETTSFFIGLQIFI